MKEEIRLIAIKSEIYDITARIRFVGAGESSGYDIDFGGLVHMHEVRLDDAKAYARREIERREQVTYQAERGAEAHQRAVEADVRIEFTEAWRFVNKYQAVDGSSFRWCNKLDHIPHECITDSGEIVQVTQDPINTENSRYEWPDGSAIVTTQSAWSFGIHRDKLQDCPQPDIYDMLTGDDWQRKAPFTWPAGIPEMSDADCCAP